MWLRRTALVDERKTNVALTLEIEELRKQLGTATDGEKAAREAMLAAERAAAKANKRADDESDLTDEQKTKAAEERLVGARPVLRSDCSPSSQRCLPVLRAQ